MEEPYKVRNRKTEKVLPFKRVKKWKKNRRLKRTVNRTKEYLLGMKSIIIGYDLVEINSSEEGHKISEQEQEQKDMNKAINNYFKNY